MTVTSNKGLDGRLLDPGLSSTTTATTINLSGYSESSSLDVKEEMAAAAPTPRYLLRSSLSGYAPGDVVKENDKVLLLPYANSHSSSSADAATYQLQQQLQVDIIPPSVHKELLASLEPVDCRFVPL
jgi:hypothetical protein